MVLQFNIFQQIFLVVYSILYGVMLQNQSGRKAEKKSEKEIARPFQPFPWGQALRNRDMRLRLVFSIVVLNILPFIYAMGVLCWLDKFNRFEYGFGNLGLWWLVFVTFWAGLGVFGFQRLYGFLAMISEKVGRPKIFKELLEIMHQQVGELSLRASVLSMVYYLAIPPFILLVNVLCQPICGFVISFAIIAFLIGWLII